MRKITAIILCVSLASCAYRGDLKSPTQIEAQQKKAEEKAAKDAAKKEKKQKEESLKKEVK